MFSLRSASWTHCALSSRCANCSNVILTLIVVFVRRILHAVLSVLGQLFQWWKLCLMCLRIVLAVTTLHILIFVLVIALSSVILGAELSTYVMCRLFYYASICLSIRKQICTQRMQGGGPKMEKLLYQPNYLTHRPESSEADPGVGGVFSPETSRHIISAMGGCVGG